MYRKVKITKGSSTEFDRVRPDVIKHAVDLFSN